MYTVSKTAIKVLTGIYTTFRLVQACWTSLTEMGYSYMELLWVPEQSLRHANVVGEGLTRVR